MTDGKLPDLIFGYLACEHENEMVSAELHKPLIDQFRIVDHMIRACLTGLRLDSNEAVMTVQLYHFVHYQLFASFTNLMRLHLSEALSCERKAIDASFTAYEILLNPVSLVDYQNRERRFQNIKNTIQKARKNDSGKYPLAETLLTAHDLGSRFGSHADISTFIFRTADHPFQNKPGAVRQTYSYFQKPDTMEEANLNFLCRLHHFLLMTKIFDPFTEKYSNLNFAAWRKDRDYKCDIFQREIDRLKNGAVA